MWLLDVNVPQRTTVILSEFGIEEAAVNAGFLCVVTSDHRFAEAFEIAFRESFKANAIQLDPGSLIIWP